MQNFRNCLSLCGLFDLGFMGQRFTCCNGRFGEQRTLVILDRMLANKRWIEQFPEAQVTHVSMVALDHCLLHLSLMKSSSSKPTSTRFVFEVMWVRYDRCSEAIESAWESFLP